MDVGAYLDRIGYRGPIESTADTLRALHRQHMLTVPFENLDIGLGREIVLDPGRLVEKIVRRHRGGFCYELNGTFHSSWRSASVSPCSPHASPTTKELRARSLITLPYRSISKTVGWPTWASAKTFSNRCGSSVTSNSKM